MKVTKTQENIKLKKAKGSDSPFPTGGHKAARNRHHSMAKANTDNKKDPQKKTRLGTVGQKENYWRASTSITVPISPLIPPWIKTHRYLVYITDP